MICVALLAALGLAVAAPIHYTVADEVIAKHDEDVLSLSTTSLDSASFDAVNSSEISAAQLDHLPGVDTYMQQGYNVLPGTPEAAFVRARIFDFDFDYAATLGDGMRYAIPALVNIDQTYKCAFGAIAESEVTTSFESTLTTQASNFQGGYEDSSDVNVGIKYGPANVGVSKTITTAVMFGNSKASSEYKARSQYRETKTFSAQTKGRSYSMNLDYDAVVEADFSAEFVTAVKELGAAPSFVDALDFYDRFGTHVLQRATLGGVQQRSAYYSADASSETLESARTQTRDSSVNLFGFGIGSSQTEHSASYMYDTNDVRFWRTDWELHGGNAGAETQGEYCQSIQDMSNPVVVGRTLYPVFDLVTKIDGVSESTAEKLEEHLAAVFDPTDSEGNGLRCEWDSDAVCTWDNAMRRHDCRACVCTIEEGAGDYHVEDPCRKRAKVPERVRYGASFNMLSVNNIGGQFWLTGARSGTGNSDIGDRAYTQNIYGNPLRGTADSYKWIIRSQPGNGDLSYEDPRASEDCVKYGDRVYLQVMSAERRWLSGGRYDGNNRVRAWDMLARGEGTPQQGDGSYRWTVRSSAGGGPRGDVDPRQGQCVSLNDKVCLQVNNLDNRWLTGGRDSGNENVWTRDGFFLWTITRAIL